MCPTIRTCPRGAENLIRRHGSAPLLGPILGTAATLSGSVRLSRTLQTRWDGTHPPLRTPDKIPEESVPFEGVKAICDRWWWAWIDWRVLLQDPRLVYLSSSSLCHRAIPRLRRNRPPIFINKAASRQASKQGTLAEGGTYYTRGIKCKFSQLVAFIPSFTYFIKAS
jgi:hypothetical protein